MKNKAILLTIAIGSPIVALLHLNTALHAATSESQSFDVIKKDGVTRLVNRDGSKLTPSQSAWINEASATNIGTAIGLNNFKVTGIVIRQDYNSFGWKAGGDVTFITSK
tara:strand:- start:540 stop:866 length:327 start_codon:yes stop_codon:yes gene_type:complete